MTEQLPFAGRRIVVYGVTGSGKTSTARALGKGLGLGVIEMDALFWQQGWVQTSREEFRAKVLAELERYPQGWVCDGNYSSVRDAILQRADTVVWLRLPWRVSFWRVLKRTLGRAWTGEVLWGTNRESLRLSFLSKDSILWWSIHHHRASQRSVGSDLAEMPHRAQVLELRSAPAVKAFLASIERGVGGSVRKS